MTIIGDNNFIAFDIGLYYADSIQQQHITTWVGGKQINPLDDLVYLPSFYTKLKNEIDWLEAHKFLRSNCDGLLQDEVFDRLENETNKKLKKRASDVWYTMRKHDEFLIEGQLPDGILRETN